MQDPDGEDLDEGASGSFEGSFADGSFDPSAPPFEPDEPAFEARTLRAFIKRDRLVSLPARERRKRVILRYLVERVLPDDEPVPEPELNARLARWNPDFASLRRYLVDSGLATRDGMLYRRGRPAS